MSINRLVVVFVTGSLLMEDPRPSKGTQIGQTINDAITAALPGTKLLFDAVKALLPASDKVKKAGVEAAVMKGAEKARDAAVRPPERSV